METIRDKSKPPFELLAFVNMLIYEGLWLNVIGPMPTLGVNIISCGLVKVYMFMQLVRKKLGPC